MHKKFRVLFMHGCRKEDTICLGLHYVFLQNIMSLFLLSRYPATNQIFIKSFLFKPSYIGILATLIIVGGGVLCRPVCALTKCRANLCFMQYTPEKNCLTTLKVCLNLGTYYQNKYKILLFFVERLRSSNCNKFDFNQFSCLGEVL